MPFYVQQKDLGSSANLYLLITEIFAWTSSLRIGLQKDKNENFDNPANIAYTKSIQLNALVENQQLIMFSTPHGLEQITMKILSEYKFNDIFEIKEDLEQDNPRKLKIYRNLKKLN